MDAFVRAPVSQVSPKLIMRAQMWLWVVLGVEVSSMAAERGRLFRPAGALSVSAPRSTGCARSKTRSLHPWLHSGAPAGAPRPGGTDRSEQQERGLRGSAKSDGAAR